MWVDDDHEFIVLAKLRVNIENEIQEKLYKKIILLQCNTQIEIILYCTQIATKTVASFLILG